MTPAISSLSNRSAPRRPHPARGGRSRATGRWALAALLLAAGCDFSLLESPKLPVWDIALTMPLINQAYPLAGVVDSSTIFADSSTQELQIQFDGALDTTRIDADFLEITLPAGASPDPINESVTAPNAADFFSAVAESVVVSFALDSLLVSTGEPQFATVSFPQAFNFPIDSIVWNSIVTVPPVSPISQVQGPTQLLDTTALLSGNSIIKSIRYITLSAAAGANQFITSVFNDDFPTDIDSIVLQLESGPLTVTHSRATLAPGNTFAETTDLASAQLGTELTMSVNLQLPVTTADTVWILANTDPKIDISVKLAVAGVDSIGIRTKQTSIVPVVPTGIALPEDVRIVSGQLRSGELVPINTISLTGLRNTLPFDINFELKFPNFSTSPSGGDTLTFGPYTLTDGAATINQTTDLSVYTFLNPDPAGGDTTAIDSFEYNITAEIVEADMALPLDGSSLGAFQVEFGVGDLYFQSITGEFDISFDAINTTIEDIPTGFAGFEFARLSLSLLFSNTIDLPVALDLDLIGVSLEGDSATVPINAPLNYPSAGSLNGAIAKTLIVLDETSVRTYWLTDGGATAADAWQTFDVPNAEASIVDVLNLPPETIIIGGGASINGTGTVAADSALWGEFQLIAPFAFIMPQDITFLPANAFALTPMDADTRKNVQTALLSASLTISTLMDLPIGGSISMLISDSTIFSLALDSLDDIAAGIPTAARTGDTTVYSSISAVLLADSIVGIDHIIFYAETATLGQTTDPTLTRAKKVEFYAGAADTVPAFFIGRLFEMTLPGPRELNSLGHVVTPGDTTETLQLDAERLGWIASETAMNMQPLITFHGASEVRTFLTTDSIHILAFLTLNLSSEILGQQEPKDSSAITVTQVPNKSIVVGETAFVDLDTVFALTGVQVTDMETAVVTSHTGIAAVTIRNISGDPKQKLLQVVGIGTGTAKITVTADDDGDDDTDAATVAFQVTVNASGSLSPAAPAVEWDEDVLELIRIRTGKRPVQ
ncbi:MAG: hypothetical protein IIA59_08005 [Candidatus Marinimicrobia bacterium]|nr:hypothetical protein [Candidatus Neomarinimicrobiota bacterium]